ncbi:MAG: trypsin-like peptidase domain-containing protein [Chloroflexi bacterium]|jgi:S1-C subfamily serine protease|nr:trypsin-like peptidase domain-containing protein [Chloroflexota bacterium]MBT4073298.1 trypsin-like peptidase domain-containing protein [Chloroflexota bacterium]MBT4513742.1 trypsin-like peptidase domain-containing protein [Chloroflexota bacterium]MBT5320245.1 trypsin-like peptidase domain-containing protein [Chloroflexota bacterium]MBT6680859.1 trypsin-like peptidase domain-containing protein [Chloroflexota bacterium]
MSVAQFDHSILRSNATRAVVMFFAASFALIAAACGGGVSDEELELAVAAAQQAAVDDAVATAIAEIPPVPTPAPTATPQPAPTPQPRSTAVPTATPGPSFASIYQNEVFGVFQIDTEDNKGSAWLIDEGVLVTNQHVVGDNDVVLVRQAIDVPFTAVVAAVDPDRDLALLFFDPLATTSRTMRTGSLTADDIADPLMALGYSEGTPKPDGSVGAARVKVGVLSQMIDLGPAGINLTMDAAIDPGESGGPVLNKFGEVVGMNRGIRVTTPDGSSPVFGTFFALHVDDIKFWYETIRTILSQATSGTPSPN